MIAIITGDIINSEQHNASEWIGILKTYLNTLGKSPDVWEIYRGDEFQIRTSGDQALEITIRIKAIIKSIKGLDVRMSIGLGKEDFIGSGVSESNGPAYQLSGRTFSKLKEQKINLAIATGNVQKDQELNLMFKLALDFMDDWSPVSAEIISLVLANPVASQKSIAKQLDIQQSAISQRQKRARLDLVQELLAYYALTINKDTL